MTSRPVFAVIPAAGRSRRMGRPKLLLTLGGQTVIARVLQVLESAVTQTVVVCRRDDPDLQQAALAGGAVVVQPEADPPDMRVSVEHALRWLTCEQSPAPDAAWLLLPADHPLIEPLVLQQLLYASREQPEQIVVPVHAGRRGHPTLLPWRLVPEVFELAPDAGLNLLIRRHDVVEVPVDSPTVLADLDTPEDYERWRRILDSPSPA